MRRSTRRKVIPLVFALVLTIVGAALAVPTFNLKVQTIGEGGPETIEVPGGVTSAAVNWVLDGSDPDYVAGVKLKFDQTVPSGTTIYVKIYDKDGKIITKKDKTLQSDLNANTEIEIDFDSNVEIKNMDQVAVVLLGPTENP